jgi:iron(III) transport system ATP-binding protein
MLEVATDQGAVVVAHERDLPVGQDVVLAARPEGVVLRAGNPTGEQPNEWSGTVVTHSYLGDAVDHIVRVGDRTIHARGDAQTSIANDAEVTVRVEPSSWSLIPLDL